MGTNTSPDPAAAPALSEPRVRELFDRYLQAWNDHDGPAAAAYMANDAVYEDVAAAQVRAAGTKSPAGWRKGPGSRLTCTLKR
jgi:ketosteroid isomerase-like protein